MKPHLFAPEILRQYDIRGTVGENLNPQDAYAIGYHFAHILKDRNTQTEDLTIAVGFDGRLSSPALAEQLNKGITEAGVEIISIPCGPTPMLYFADHFYETDAAIMVTGSHNPANMNGFKMVMGHRPFFDEDIQELGNRAKEYIATPEANPAQIDWRDCRAEYVMHLLAETAHWKEDYLPTIVWDAGNGAAGEIVQIICDHLPGNHYCLFTEIDGRFPNHHPDPTVPKNLVDLQRAIEKHDADFGVAFDGDGDRIGVILPDGEILWGDRLMMLLALDVLKDNPGAVVIADVKSSDKLFSFIEDNGGIPEIWKTGHALIKTRMKETGAKLAGEMSGHIFFADRNAGYDDAIYSALRVMTAVSLQGGDLTTISQSFPNPVATPEVRIPCPEHRKAEVIEATKQRLDQLGIRFLDIDGMRVKTRHGWWLMRASNTEPILVVRAEADSEESLDILCAQISQYLLAADLDIPDFR